MLEEEENDKEETPFIKKNKWGHLHLQRESSDEIDDGTGLLRRGGGGGGGSEEKERESSRFTDLGNYDMSVKHGKTVILRKWVFDCYFGDTRKSKITEWGLQIATFINVLNVIASTALVVANTTHKFTAEEVLTLLPLIILDAFTMMIFILDYVLRLWVIVEKPKNSHWIKGRLRWCISPLAIIDLLSFLPYLVTIVYAALKTTKTGNGSESGPAPSSELSFAEAFVSFCYYSEFTAFRVFRILRSRTYIQALKTLKTVVVQNHQVLLTVLFTVVAILVLHATLLWYAMSKTPFRSSTREIISTMWVSMLQLTGMGGFDNYQFTRWGKALSSFAATFAIAIFAIPAGVLASGFQNLWEKKKKKAKKEEKLRKAMEKNQSAAANWFIVSGKSGNAESETKKKKNNNNKSEGGMKTILEKLVVNCTCHNCNHQFKVLSLNNLKSHTN